MSGSGLKVRLRLTGQATSQLIVDASAQGTESERDFPACGAGVADRHARAVSRPYDRKADLAAFAKATASPPKL